ncbi:glycosyltransferase [Cereibacter sp. SYSU M97828]|nr:glycosyltransferase [Cereibacter flavus]
MNAFYMIVDEAFIDIASAQSLNLVEKWDCDVHIFIERRDGAFLVREVKHPKIIYHYEELTPLLPKGLPGTKSWPNIVYLRLLAPSVLTQYSRIIHLDADIHCMKADQAVWDIPLPHGIGAVSDYATLDGAPLVLKGMTRASWLESIGVDSDRYANAGFLLIDPKMFSRHDYIDLLPQHFTKFPHARHFDQDFLNAFYAGKWVELGPRFNYQAKILELGYTDIVDPVFIHFSRRQKPWWGQNDDFYFPTDPKFTRIYDDLLCRAGFDPEDYRQPASVSIGRRIKYRVYRWMGRLGIPSLRERSEIALWKSRADRFHDFLCISLHEGRFADEDRKSLPLSAEVPHFDGRFVKTWRSL